MDESLKPPYLQKDDQRGDFQVWIVDGPYVRGHIDEEFTNFGQHYRYPYIPELEFWIDQEAEHDERAFFIDHLLAEYSLMAKGASYGDALTQAATEGPLLINPVVFAECSAGFPSAGHYVPILENGSFRLVGKGSPPQPADLAAHLGGRRGLGAELLEPGLQLVDRTLER